MAVNKKVEQSASSVGLAGRPVSPEEIYARKKLIIYVATCNGLNYFRGEDLVQEIALKCYEDPKICFDPNKGTLEGYVTRIARNMAVDMWRKDKHLPELLDDVEIIERLDAQNDEMEDGEYWESRGELLERGIVELYRKYPSKLGNDAFVLFFRDEMSAKSVAEKLQVEERFVNVAVRRGRERLAEILLTLELQEKSGIAC